MHLTLHLTRACNLRCPYCYAPPRTGPSMTVDTGRKALEFGLRMTEGSCGIVFFGGEPLLCKDTIRALVAEAREIEHRGGGRFHFKLTTNGLLLDEPFLQFALDEDILIGLSFDGVREAHDRGRRMPDGSGTFDRLLPKLQMLLGARPYSSLLMVVNPDTVRWFAESVAFSIQEGARYLIVSLNYAGGWTDATLGELQRQYDELGRLYIEWCREGRKFYLSPLEVKLASHILGDRARCHRCELGVRQLSVDPEGFLYPCVQFTRAGPASRWCIGHVEGGLDEAARERLRVESEAEKTPCRQCAIRSRCQHTCGCLNWQATGSITHVSPVLCRSEQMLVEVADRVGNCLFAERNRRFLEKHYDPAYPLASLLEDLALS